MSKFRFTFKWYHMIFVFLWLTSLNMINLYVYPYCCKWHYFILYYGWAIFLCVCVCVCVCNLISSFICQWTFRLLPCLAAAKSLQSCLTLCDPVDSSPPGSSVPGILQARTLEWVAISFSNAWKWKVKSLSRARLLVTHGLQPARLLRPWDFPGKSPGVGCHCYCK